MATFSRRIYIGVIASLMVACVGDIGDSRPSGVPLCDSLPPDAHCDPFLSCEAGDHRPGRVTIRRLSAREFDRTMESLLLLQAPSNLSDALPVDDESTDGFRNDADVLNLGPLTLAKYDRIFALEAAAAIRRDAFLERYLPCGDETCVDDFVARFGAAAWRRPLDDEEAARVGGVIQDGAERVSLEHGLTLGMRTILLSPHSLFRAEPHVGDRRALNGYEVASRLSYFLWSGPPDEELYELAAAGRLNDDATLRAQVIRMIEDPRFDEFIEGFVHRWLGIGSLAEHYVDEEAFAGFDDALVQSMLDETSLFFLDVLRNDLPLRALLDADFSYVNERLAAHYDLPELEGAEMRRVELMDGRRGGILRQASVLTATSHSKSTSPVLRGKWILDRLLCSPPPAAPPDVTSEVEAASADGLTRRERLEQHRGDPQCSPCHAVMDPYGFALENFDYVGRWRESDDSADGAPIDASDTLPDGAFVDGPESLADALAEDGRVPTCVARKLVAYGLGRSLVEEDLCFVEEVSEASGRADASLRSVLVNTVLSELFREVSNREEDEEVMR